jgi:Domain of unknown function (DUF1083).
MKIDSHSAAVTQAIASYSPIESGPEIDPASGFWSHASRIVAESDFNGRSVPNHRTEILLQWTPAYLYTLFICPYEQLHLKPAPNLTAETYELWNYDVAELFISDDFANIRRYKEFEVSPQGEWVDLDVDLDDPPHERGWVWQSGMEAAARIDVRSNTWYGFMRIPWQSIAVQPPTAGHQFRANFYRCQGSDPDRKYIAWQPVHRPSFHTPECFGTLTLAEP